MTEHEKFQEVADLVAEYSPNVDNIFIDTIGGFDFLVVEFRSNTLSVRNISGNSFIANLAELFKLVQGGYYREVEWYKELKDL